MGMHVGAVVGMVLPSVDTQALSQGSLSPSESNSRPAADTPSLAVDEPSPVDI